MKILVVNAGSSSLKYQLINMKNDEVLAKGNCSRIGVDGKVEHKANGQKHVINVDMPDHKTAISLVLKYLTDDEFGVIDDVKEIGAVGHRVVNGGEIFSESTLMDEEKIKTLESLTDFAPLHNPPAVTCLRACIEVMGKDVPMVTVFDTAFHQTMPKEASMYAIDKKYYEKYGIRRFGAHGTSHKYVAKECGKLLGVDWKDLKIITCHLGAGSSITAVDHGKSVDTSMGFTPLAGLMMGTRCGNIDASVVTYIMEKEGLTPAQMNNILNKESGILAVSGMSSDFRDLEDAYVENGNPEAGFTLMMYRYQILKYIGAYTAVMNGVDAIVFTAGVGENNFIMRERLAKQLEYLGVKIDPEKNHTRSALVDFSAPDSKVKMVVVPTNEELAIAQDTYEIVSKL